MDLARGVELVPSRESAFSCDEPEVSGTARLRLYDDRVDKCADLEDASFELLQRAKVFTLSVRFDLNMV
jgi:hypothetical protein